MTTEVITSFNQLWHNVDEMSRPFHRNSAKIQNGISENCINFRGIRLLMKFDGFGVGGWPSFPRVCGSVRVRGILVIPRQCQRAFQVEFVLRGALYENRPKLKGSIGEGSNHSNFSDRSSVKFLGIQRKPRKAPARKKPLQRSSIRPKIQEGAARMERKGKQTALRERGVRRPRTGAKDARLAIKRCYA